MSATALKERLRVDLKAAMRERRAAEVGVIRALIAALDNAEAVCTEGLEERIRLREHVGDIARRELDGAEVDGLLAGEIVARKAAAADYRQGGRDAEAAALLAEIELIARYRAS